MSWALSTYVLLLLALAGGFAWYERSRPPAKTVALAAALAALAIAGRIAFAALPNVKPTTDIVLFAGYAIGGAPGFAVGAVSAAASNLFFGQGPWTPWQMAAWGGVGVAGAALGAVARARGRDLGRWSLAAACGLAGLAFGAFMDIFQWTLTAGHDLGSYLAVSATSLPFNLAHAVGNVVFCLLLGPPMIRALRRYRRRFEVRWAPAGAGGSLGAASGPREPGRAAVAPGAASAVAVAVVALAAAVGLAAAPPARASSASSRAASYLAGAQNRDGGFGDAPRHGSAQLFTGWSALGLAAAGRNPDDVRHGGPSAVDFTRAHAGSLNDTGELERTILVLGAAGVSPRHFAHRDLVAELLRRRGRDGSFNRLVNLTAFGVLAMRAAGVSAGDARVQRAAGWLEAQRNGDGGFGFSPRASSDADDTGAVLEALGAAGRRGSAAAGGAVRYLRDTQSGDGGFSGGFGGSNAQSTAWAVQGLVAVGADSSAVRRALGYLTSLQAGDGSIRYARGVIQTPVWVTAEALAALRRQPFPIPAVPRRASARGAAAAAASAPAGAGATGGGGSAAGQGAGSGSSSSAPGAAAAAGLARAIAAADRGGSPFDRISAAPGHGRAAVGGRAIGAAAGSPLAAGVAAGASLFVLLAAEWWRRSGRRLPLRRGGGAAAAPGAGAPVPAGSPSG